MRPKDPLPGHLDQGNRGLARQLGRGLGALILAGAATATQLPSGKPASLNEIFDVLDRQTPRERIEQGLPLLERGLHEFPEQDADYPWALQLQAEILLSADRCNGVFELCERAAQLNQALIAKAHAEPDGRAREAVARITAIYVAHQKAYLWQHLGLVDRFAEAIEEEQRQCQALEPLAEAQDRLGPLLCASIDATHFDLAQQRTADALESCSKLRAALQQPGVTPDPQQWLQVDMLEASVRHDRCMEGHLDSALASSALLDVIAHAESDPGTAHDALLLLIELDLANARWPDAREHLDRIRALDSNAARSTQGFEIPLENEARLRGFEGRLALETHAPREELARRRDALQQAIEKTLASWRATPPPAAGLGVLLWGTQRASLAALIDLELALDEAPSGPERALSFLMHVQEVGTLARRMGCAPATLDDLRRELLDESSGCLIYLPAPDRTQVFLLTRGRVEPPLHLDSQDLLQETLAPWLELANAPRPEAGDAREEARRLQDFDELGRRARSRLLPDELLARIAGWKHVHVLGTELLMRFPIEKLPLADGTPFGVHWAVSRLPSLPVGLQLARAKAQTTLDCVLVAAPVPSAAARQRWSEVGELPVEPGELDRLAVGTDAERSPRFLHERACLSRSVIDSLARSRMGVVLAHGTWNARVERPPTILLSEGPGTDGFVSAAELEALARTPPFVELLACESSRGRSRFGDDCNSLLPAALFLRGTTCVLQATTNVPLHGTVEFASAVNARLWERGDSMAEAVRAVREARYRDPQHRDPAEWGLLVVEGLGTNRPFAAHTNLGTDTKPEPDPAESGWVGLVARLALALAVAAAACVAVVRRRRR